MKPSYDDETLAAYFQPLSRALWDDPIVGPVLRDLERTAPVLLEAVADVDRTQIRDALASTPFERLRRALGVGESLTGWRRVAG